MQDITKRLVRWAVGVVLFLMIPLVLTIRDGAIEGVGWNWSPFDFVFMFVLLFGAGALYEFIARKVSSRTHRIMVGVAITVVVMLIWVNAAVGIFS